MIKGRLHERHLSDTIILRHALRHVKRHFVCVLRTERGKASTYDHAIRKMHRMILNQLSVT